MEVTMVSAQAVDEQLKHIGFNKHSWGRAEVQELPNVILPDEEIYECVNGIYEGGFALLVATDVRVLLVDKKPFNFLTVEDLRFDMINEIDYYHRLFGAYISITSGDKNLRFRSYNKARLRKLINHVQHCMAENKKKQNSHQQDQKQHLESINQQLQAYLRAQYDHQQELHRQLKEAQATGNSVELQSLQTEAPKPSPELSDYLFAQSLLNQYQRDTGRPVTSLAQVANEYVPASAPVQPGQSMPSVDAQPGQVPQQAVDGLSVTQATTVANASASAAPPTPAATAAAPQDSQMKEIYADGVKEVFGKRLPSLPVPVVPKPNLSNLPNLVSLPNPLEINPWRIAASKLPMAWRIRKFGQGGNPLTAPRH